MKKKLLSRIIVLFYTSTLICNMFMGPVLASAHTHTDDCYNGTVHVHTGSYYSGGGCYGGINYHYHYGNSSSGGGCYGGVYYHSHSGSSTSGGGCYGSPVYHSHSGNSSSGGGCYGSAIYHSHAGSSTSGGGCYGEANYHSHSGSSTSGGGCYGDANYHSHSGNSTSGGGCYGQANYHSHSGSSASGGGCYGKANYHSHSGSSTSGGGCYGQANYHVHTGSTTSGGGCYGYAIYHSHISSCYGTCGGSRSATNVNGQTKYVCTRCGSISSSSGTCSSSKLICSKSTSTPISYNRNCGKTTSSIDNYSRNCGKTTSSVESYSRDCGKTTSTVESYSRNCGKTTSTVESYSRNCGKSTSTIESYSMNCGKTTSTVTGYALNCGKSSSTIERYNLNCGKTSNTIEGYYLNCGRSSSNIDGYYMNCGKTAGIYYNGGTQVFPTCSSVVTCISPINQSQTVYKGGMIDTTATATYLDGSTGTVSCTASSFNANTLGDQTVTLTYSGLVGNAKTNGTRTCTLKVTVLDINISVGITNSISSIRLDASVGDAVSVLAANPYRYTIGGITTDWLTSNSYTGFGLTPNTSYNYTVEIKDKMGNISENTGTAYTKADIPSTTIDTTDEGKIQILVKDNNPEGTQYCVQVGSLYADDNGNLSNMQNWILIPYDSILGGRKFILSGLSTDTAYAIIVSAKNNISGDIVKGNNTAITTSPGVPSNFSVSSVTESNISLSWSNVPGAVYYELLRTTVTADGTVISTKSIPGIITSYYNDKDVVADQRYLYIIRCKNNNDVYGKWSETPLSVKTWPLPPTKVTGVAALVDGSSLDITWDSINDAIGYEVEVTYNGIVRSERVATNQILLDTTYPDQQCNIKIKAFNGYNGNDSSDDTSWSNEGEWSNEYICYTEANVPILDPIEEGQYAINSTNIIWNTNNNPDSVQYKLGIYKFGSLDTEVIITGASAGDGKLSYKITGLSPETTYNFKLKAVNTYLVESEWSNEISITTMMDEPAIITGLRATAKSDRISLYWNAIDRAQSYEIERNGSIIASGITSSNYVDTEVTSDTEYTYKVMAVNTSGNSGWSSPLVKKTLGNLPVCPNIISASGSSISCTIEWTVVEAVTGYDIEVDGIIYNVGMDTIYEDNGLLPGSQHSYRVRARNIYGKSSWSDAVTYYSMPNAPDIPSNISASASDTQICITWDGVVGAEFYEIEINGIVYSNIYASEYWYTPIDGDLSGSEYAICVRAVNVGGNSEWSTSLNVALSPEGSIPTLPIPSIPTLTNTTGSVITIVSWNQVENATQYQVEADDSIIYTGTGTSFVQANLPEGSQHVYRVRAGNSSGFSEWSNSVTVIVGLTTSVTPENINYYRVSDSRTAIIWNKADNAKCYQIEVNGVILDEYYEDTTAEITTIPGVQYTIRIASVIQNEEDTMLEWSDEMVFCSPSALPGVVEIANTSAASEAVTITWVEVPGAHGYEIECDGQIIKTDDNLSYTFTGLNTSTSYTVRVRAYNEAGAGEWCETVTVMTNEEIPGVPINITCVPVVAVSDATGSSIKIRWDVLEGASSYEVEGPDGKIYTTNKNEIIILNLNPGIRYNFRLRAISDAGIGAWSSKISVTPVLTAPVNLSIKSENGVIHLSWDKVGGAELYEIEIDGVIMSTTNNSYIELDHSIFYVQRTVRVRAVMGTQKSEWSLRTSFEETLPIKVDLLENEVISILLPVENAEIGKYKLILQYNPNEMTLLDACEITQEKELTSSYIDELNMHIIIEQNGEIASITFVFDDVDNLTWSGIASKVQFKSNVTGPVTLQYSAKLR